MTASPPDASHRRTHAPPRQWLRTLTLLAIALGAIGSVAFTLAAGERAPRFLMVLFVVWVLAPFAGLVGSTTIAKRWSSAASTIIHSLGLFVAGGSLIVYSGRAGLRPPAMPNAFVFLVVPMVSWVLIAGGLLMAWRLARPTSAA